ncbi:transketolase [Achromatium sp. WMS2]|nr:transketolase [Achromatium sp. WMS2]
MSERRTLANAIRALSMDAIQKAKSGHPGAPMGMADIAEVLWNDYLVHNPANPKWINRDRFVLSNGHGSMLIYSLLHLSGYDLTINDLKSFRQIHSRTPGHPEYGYAPGVETTTGPLGQGISNAVGMAIAEKTLAAQFNRPEHNIIDHYTYVFLGDGCMMEGISHEACSLAGTLGLGKLIAFYDDNNISIDGEIRGSSHAPAWFTDDTPARFAAYGWQVIPKVDGHDANAIKEAIEQARANQHQPTLICCQTIIGFGSPNKQGKEECHGAPLGDAEIALTKEALNWPHAAFEIPSDVANAWDAKAKGATAESKWQESLNAYQAAYPELGAELQRRVQGNLPDNWEQQATAFINEVNVKADTVATRKASQNCLNFYGPLLPELLGGSADLAGSNLTIWKGCKGLSKTDSSGNYLHYGVREFGMAAIMNGIELHGGFKTYGATFLMFSEYARNALRMAALMRLTPIYVFTHDSIGLGEDGPTHQPVEQTASLRLIPRMSVWRPCDQVETAIAWKLALERKTGPTSLILSRQNLPHSNRTPEQIAAIQRGGYVLRDSVDTPEVIIIATGSEIELALNAHQELTNRGRQIRVVSMPSTDTFDAQNASYRESVLPASCLARVAIEAGTTSGWRQYVGLNGRIIGIDTFGESAPASDVYKHFGIVTEAVVAAAESLI